MRRRRRRQLELGFSTRGGGAAAAQVVEHERAPLAELDLGYGRLRNLYELGKLLVSDAPDEAALRCLARTVPLRVAMLVALSGGSAHAVAARAAAVPEGELQAALAHARSCLSRLCGAQPIAEGTVTVDPEPLPAGQGRLPPGSSPFAALPLLLGRTDVSGVLYVRGARGLREADLAFLSAAADHLSLARDRRFAWEREVQLRERAEALDRKQKDLVAVVSHDLRNPLGAVLIGVSTLRKWPQLDAQRVRENLDSIHRAAERASRLVHDLLDVARIDAGHLQLELAPLDLGALAKEAAELMKPLLAQAQLTCEAEVAEGMSPVLADRERILQVLSNLIGNARKFGRPGSVVSIAVWEEHGEARCCVSDEGPGISEEDLPHIFDRYFQGPHGPTAHGVGLGLSIARGIVEAHGGRIWADSAPGKGSRFFFSVPLTPP
ncbi:MAG TPA: ATP-binding protein [Myxococcales bacterium]